MEVAVSVTGPATLEHACPVGEVDWLFVASGYWSQDVYHGGHIAYYLAKTAPDTWVLQSVESDPDSEELEVDDVEQASSNGNAASSQRIVAVCRGAPLNATPEKIAAELYMRVCRAQRFSIEDRDDIDGLLSPKS